MAREKIGDSPETVVAVRDSGMTLFGSDNPREVINRASKVADVLADVVNKKKMFTMIGQGKHLRIEAWQTLGALTGVFAVIAWTRKLENGWEARCEVRTRNGDLVGAAESECLNTEANWSESKRKDDHALRSMAQTRASSKALSMPLRFIVALAGYEGTPAEEMPSEPRPSDQIRRPAQKAVQETTQEAQPKAGKGDSTGSGAGKGSQDAPRPQNDATGDKVWSGKIKPPPEGVSFRTYPKKGRDGKPTGETGRIYSINTVDGKTFKTFSDSFAEDCKFAGENDEAMTIGYSEKEFRGVVEFNAVTCVPAGLADQEPEPDRSPEGPEEEA